MPPKKTKSFVAYEISLDPYPPPISVTLAAKYSDETLKDSGKDREWIAQFYRSLWPNALEGSVSDDSVFIKAVRTIQAFVFGDEGDMAIGVAPSFATAKEVDGYLGEGTRRRMLAWESTREPLEAPTHSSGAHLLWEGVPFEVKGLRVSTYQDPGGLDLYRMGERKPGRWRSSEKNKWTVLATDHWDVCTSSKKCASVLSQRGYSSNFGIDNPDKDGISTVHLWLDPGIYRGAHAGSPGNSVSALSFDYSNAVDISKYAKLYEQRVGQPRPVISATFHGRTKTLLGMYAGQVIAGMRVKQAYSNRVGVPFIRPLDKDGMPFQTVLHGLGDGIFKGAVTHLNWTDQKWDVAGLVEQEIALLLIYPQLQKEFPEYCAHVKISDSKWGPWLDKVRSSWKWDDVFSRVGVHPAVVV